MQFISQAPVAVPVQPAPIVVEQNANEKKLEQLKKQAEQIGKHIKYCAYFLLVSGVIGILQSVHCYVSSRKWAKFIVEEKKMPWGHHGKHGEHHAERPGPEPHKPHFMLEDEWMLYDILKNIGTLSFIVFAVIFAAGCMSKRVVKTQNKWCAAWKIRKIISCYIIFVVMYLMSKQQGHAFKAIFMRVVDQATQDMMLEKSKHKFGMCPVMLVFLIVKAFNIYKLKCYQHTLEKISLVEEHKKEQEKKDKIIAEVQAMNN